MPEKTGQKREAPISYRPPAALREEFYARVEKSGLSVSAFLTKAVFDKDPPRQSRRPVAEAKMLAQLLAQAAHIRDQLHEISLASGDGANAVLMERAMDDLADIRAALLKIMGRRP